MNEQQNRPLVSASENRRIDRDILVWLNDYPDKPVDVIRYEELPADDTGMALSPIQGAYIIKRYIVGGYLAEYQFKVIYRIKSPGTSIDKRLKAVEALDALSDWAAQQLPQLTGARATKLQTTARAAMFGRYENGDEDYQVLMKLNYEVI